MPVSGDKGMGQGISARSGVTMEVMREGYPSVLGLGDGSGNFCMVWSHYGSDEGRILLCLEISLGVREFLHWSWNFYMVWSHYGSDGVTMGVVR